MKMLSKTWDEMSMRFLNDCFDVLDAGPLHSPIEKFHFRRLESLQIELLTTSKISATRDLERFPEPEPGNVSSLNARITFESQHSPPTIAYGVHPVENKVHSDTPTRSYVREQRSLIQKIESIPTDTSKVAYLVEWIDNLDLTFINWPDPIIIKSSTETKIETQDGQVLLSSESTTIEGKGGLITEIGGCKISIIPGEKNSFGGPNGQATIIYEGFRDQSFREKLRNCIALTIGTPLVSLGFVLLDADHTHLGFQASSPYTIGHSIYRIAPIPPAPLSTRHSSLIDKSTLTNIADAFWEHYDCYDLRHVCWLYWHAACSPTHAHAVQLGAAIESLINSHHKHEPSAYRKSILDKANFRALSTALIKKLSEFDLSEDEYKEINLKILNMNSASQRTINDRFFAHLNLDLSKKEKDAWQRRNDSAHGNPSESGEQIDLIRDIHLLENLFHRILLKLTGASHQYIDRYTEGHPIRLLAESIEAPTRRKL